MEKESCPILRPVGADLKQGGLSSFCCRSAMWVVTKYSDDSLRDSLSMRLILENHWMFG